MNTDQIQAESNPEWKPSVKLKNGKLRIVMKATVDEEGLEEIFDSAKTKCSRCEINLIDTNDVMAELEVRYGNVIPELHGDICSIVNDIISGKVQEAQDFDYPHLCTSCAYAVRD